jgi:D-alanyl-D-alanine carboxypeptidase (penicillin-binding protein 5/6)
LIRFYDGCDGGKTGFTNEAGFCLAATAKRGEMRVISVVLGEADSKTRFKEVSESFDYTFANYSLEKMIDSSKNLENAIEVNGGKARELPIKASRDGYVFVKRGDKSDTHIEFEFHEGVKAPIKAGDKVGVVHIFQNSIEIDCIPLVASINIDKAGYFDILKLIAKDWNFVSK